MDERERAATILAQASLKSWLVRELDRLEDCIRERKEARDRHLPLLPALRIFFRLDLSFLPFFALFSLSANIPSSVALLLLLLLLSLPSLLSPLQLLLAQDLGRGRADGRGNTLVAIDVDSFVFFMCSLRCPFSADRVAY